MMLIRAMSPAVVAVDELGDYEDIHAIENTRSSVCWPRFTAVPLRIFRRSRFWNG